MSVNLSVLVPGRDEDVTLTMYRGIAQSGYRQSRDGASEPVKGVSPGKVDKVCNAMIQRMTELHENRYVGHFDNINKINAKLAVGKIFK